MITPDVAPVAWRVWRETPSGDDLVLYREAKATVDALQARIDELASNPHPWKGALEGTILKIGERIDALGKDAARYRWLRVQPNDATVPRIDVVLWEFEDEAGNSGQGLRLEALDAAIDAAIKANP